MLNRASDFLFLVNLAIFKRFCPSTRLSFEQLVAIELFLRNQLIFCDKGNVAFLVQELLFLSL